MLISDYKPKEFILFTLNTCTLFNIVEAPIRKLLNFDVCVV